MGMKKSLRFIIFLFCINLVSSQDCNCKFWKKTTINSNNKLEYQYVHGCNQPNSEYEFMGYDYSYCEKLKEIERRKALDLKNTNDAYNILKSTKKIEEKESYKVIAWWGKFLGNTGKWDAIGEPRCGIKPDSTFIIWNEDNSIKFTGKIKNRRLDGLYSFQEGPFYELKLIGEHLGIELTHLTPDFVYFNEIGKYEHFSLLKEKNKIERNITKDLYEYYNENKKLSICENYLFSNGKIFLFSKSLEYQNAIQIKEYIIKSEVQNVKNHLESLKAKLIKVTEKYNNINNFYDKILNVQLNDFDLSVCGKWDFFTNFEQVSIELVQLLETYDFKKNHTFNYKASLNFESSSYKLRELNQDGIWFSQNDKIILLPPKESCYDFTKQKIIKNDISLLILNINHALQDYNYLNSLISLLKKGDDINELIIIEDLLNYKSKNKLSSNDYDVNSFSKIYKELINLEDDVLEKSKFVLPFPLINSKLKQDKYFAEDTYFYYYDKGDTLNKKIIFTSLRGKKTKE